MLLQPVSALVFSSLHSGFPKLLVSDCTPEYEDDITFVEAYTHRNTSPSFSISMRSARTVISENHSLQEQNT